MQQTTINVPDNFPLELLKEKIKELEKTLQEEAKSYEKTSQKTTDLKPDPWDTLDIEAIAVDTGRTDGSINHDHYIYGSPKK